MRRDDDGCVARKQNPIDLGIFLFFNLFNLIY
jgi:hypothetical protein